MENLSVISEQLHSTVLKLCHDHASLGHFGIDCTWTRLLSIYFWPNARSDVTNWIESCLICSSFNPPPQGYNKAPLQPIESSESFKIVCYNLAGPFIPASDTGHTYVLILVDHFSKLLKVIPLKETNAPTCCSFGSCVYAVVSSNVLLFLSCLTQLSRAV